MPPIARKEDLTADQQACLQMVQDRFSYAERFHQQFASRWNTWYGLSRNWRRGQSAFQQANTPNDKDVVIDDLKRTFGQELFIPYCFTVIETNVPRIISRTPRYRALPMKLDETVEQARIPMEKLYERDAARMKYERKLQETVRSGLRYGLGVQKSYWEKKTRSGKKITKRMYEDGQKADDSEVVVFEGPQTESVDIFDFFWDPSGYDLDTCDYLIHRTWRSFDYVRKMVAEGRRNREEGKDQGWLDLDLEEARKLASTTGRGEAWAGRYEAAGVSNYDTQGDELFEVWEYHDRDKVVTVLGGKSGLLVQEDINPFLHGDFPFEIYRPTIVEHEFVGVGEVEPIAHLQWELNTMRGQRRDAATVALNRGYFYTRGSLNPEEVTLGAGVFNPVRGDPKDSIFPMPIVDLPASGYQEEAAIKSDIELATAMSESVIGSGAEETATGTQMVQQAAGLRIKQKARNLHVDLLAPEAKKRKAIYEQFVVAFGQTQTVRVEDPTTPTGYAYLEVTPEMFAAPLEMVPVDGSTEADDPAQKKHDAGELATALAPFAEKLKTPELIKRILSQYDIENPDEWINEGPTPDEAAGQMAQQVAGKFADVMDQAGIDPELAEQILEAVQGQMAAEQEQGGGGPAPESEEPAAEEAPPEPIGAQ